MSEMSSRPSSFSSALQSDSSVSLLSFASSFDILASPVIFLRLIADVSSAFNYFIYSFFSSLFHVSPPSFRLLHLSLLFSSLPLMFLFAILSPNSSIFDNQFIQHCPFAVSIFSETFITSASIWRDDIEILKFNFRLLISMVVVPTRKTSIAALTYIRKSRMILLYMMLHQIFS